MVDYETLKLYTSLSTSQMCTYIFKDLITRYCLYLVKHLNPNRHPFSNWFYDSYLVAMDLTSREIHVYRPSRDVVLEGGGGCQFTKFMLNVDQDVSHLLRNLRLQNIPHN